MAGDGDTHNAPPGVASSDAAVTNVVLTGFMGTGKTTIGRLLAERLGFDFVDTDALIERRHGPIPDIFRDYGEATFRSYEREVAAELGEMSSLVVSTGGRLMLDTDNAAALRRNGSVFCLTATVDTILARVLADQATQDRPLLAGGNVRERIEALLADRAGGYATFDQVATDRSSPEAIVDEILKRLTPQAPAPQS